MCDDVRERRRVRAGHGGRHHHRHRRRRRSGAAGKRGWPVANVGLTGAERRGNASLRAPEDSLWVFLGASAPTSLPDIGPTRGLGRRMRGPSGWRGNSNADRRSEQALATCTSHAGADVTSTTAPIPKESLSRDP